MCIYLVYTIFFNITVFIFYTFSPTGNKFFIAIDEKFLLSKPFSDFGFHFVVILKMNSFDIYL